MGLGRTCLLACALAPAQALRLGGSLRSPSTRTADVPRMVASVAEATYTDEITAEKPLHVLIASAGVGGLALANQLELSDAHVKYTVLE